LFVIVTETLRHPIRHMLLLMVMMVIIVVVGVSIGAAIRYLTPGAGIGHFMIECTFWLVAVVVLASPLAIKPFRNRLVEAIPR
jgi:hypothetical protein